MCGIFGVFDRNSRPVELTSVKGAIRTLQHRGPDAEGVDTLTESVIFAHRRLSIIDLGEQSNQPLHYAHLTIVFNGEIYNYIELRTELMDLGFSFKTKSDTEVIAAAYLKWKDKCVQHFNGMWAFAIYNAEENSIFCSRDRFGVKPFNYVLHENVFVFASEIKSIIDFFPELRKPEYNSISRYCRDTTGAQSKETWFANIFRLPPGHNLKIDKNEIQIDRYWRYPKNQLKISLEEATEEYLRLFESSVRFRMRSDVPIGLTLSGGLDSASIACSVHSQFPQSLNTYTATFPGEVFDEYPIAKHLSHSLGYQSNPITIDYSNYTSTLQKIIFHLESGHGSPATFPLWFIAERARKDVTVFLEGQGADELLGGYVNTVFLDYFKDNIKKGNIRKAILEAQHHAKHWPLLRSILLNIRSKSSPSINRFYSTFKGLNSLYIGPLSAYKASTYRDLDILGYDSYLNSELSLLQQTGLVNLLHYGDAISMAHSLENRLPFMDYRLVEFVNKLPPEFKIHKGLGKFIHRKAFKDILPKSIVNNPSKLGFVSPLKHVFLEKRYGALEVLTSDEFRSRGLFNTNYVNKLLENHQSLKVNNERILFKILSTELWFRNFIDNAVYDDKK